MGSIRVLKNPRVITAQIEADDHEFVKDHVKDFSKWLREQERHYREEIEFEKKVIALNKGAIKFSNTVDGVNNTTTLDLIKMSRQELCSQLKNIQDYKIINEIDSKMDYLKMDIRPLVRRLRITTKKI